MLTISDEAYFVAFSILLLHSDAHNKNNKRKMQKQDYIKNTQDQVEVAQDILECFYDNVLYTPFIHFEDEVAINSHRLAGSRSRKNLFKTPSSDTLKGPVDPYALILDNKLDQLRPSLKDVMHTEDTYSATGSPKTVFNAEELHSTFVKSGILQIVSARSRPDAFLTPATITNPAGAQAGLVDIRAAKVGLLWRKDPKKKKTRSPWQEWGAILTSSQLYFFRDLPWIKTLISQAQTHVKNGNDSHSVVFRPPLTEFKPDELMSMDDSVAMVDSAYKRHKNAFTFIKHGGFEEVFLANDEPDMNDWIAKMNYAATFRTAGIRIRGINATDSGGRPRSFNRASSAVSEKTIPTTTGDVHIQTRKPDQQVTQEIVTYRRQLMLEKVEEADKKLESAQKELENLLRNARHLQVLTPIQQKTREGLVFAAGKMSAKLKWTRVDMSRTQCHREILQLDMEEEQEKNPALFKRESSTHHAQPTPSQAALARLESSPSNVALSPSKSGRSDGIRPFSSASTTVVPNLEAQLPRRSSIVSKHSSQTSLKQSAAVTVANADLKDDLIAPQSSPVIRGLSHKASTVSTPSRSEAASLANTSSRLATPTRSNADGGEEGLLLDAGVPSVDGPAAHSIRPGTSESEPDQGVTNATENTSIDRSKVRRSLHRTLRDSHGSLPSHNRSKKGRDSNSAAGTVDDPAKSTTESSEGLTRGTGSFTVHGKKASVITFGQEWSGMSPEERLKSKREARESMRSIVDLSNELSFQLETEREESVKSADAILPIGLPEKPSGNSLPEADVDDTKQSKGKEKAIDQPEMQGPEVEESNPPTSDPKVTPFLQQIYA